MGGAHAHVAAPTAAATLLIVAFWWYSPGLSLIVTFVPMMILAWVMYMVRSRKGPLPNRDALMMPFLLAIMVQLLHFGEEFVGRFYVRFPGELFGARSFSAEEFVVFNMAAYAVFIGAFLGVCAGARAPMLIMWFVVCMMVFGNAIGHIVYCIAARGYFPGVATAQLFWPIGIWLVRALWVCEQRNGAPLPSADG